MSSYPTLPFDTYTRFSAFSPAEAKAYEAQNLENKKEIDYFAQFLLATLRGHAHVAVHGDQWKNRFKISKNASALETAIQIFETLQATLRLRNRANLNAEIPPPSLNIETFNNLYRQDLADRIQFFCRSLEFMTQERKFEMIRKQIIECIKDHSDSDPTNYGLCEALTIQAIHHGWGDLLWYASATANYWEAIRFLKENQIPIPLTDRNKADKTPLEVAQKLNHLEWIHEFENHLGQQDPQLFN